MSRTLEASNPPSSRYEHQLLAVSFSRHLPNGWSNLVLFSFSETYRESTAVSRFTTCEQIVDRYEAMNDPKAQPRSAA